VRVFYLLYLTAIYGRIKMIIWLHTLMWKVEVWVWGEDETYTLEETLRRD
jgi:hypothetical protein